jgi:hypothetical protein
LENQWYAIQAGRENQGFEQGRKEEGQASAFQEILGLR